MTAPEAIRSQKLAASDTALFAFNDHRENWIDCNRSREQPLCHPAVGHRSATICHLNGIAERRGEVVRCDPEKEELVDPSEAVLALFSRHRREGYELSA